MFVFESLAKLFKVVVVHHPRKWLGLVHQVLFFLCPLLLLRCVFTVFKQVVFEQNLLPLRTLRVGLGSHELGTPKSLRPSPDCRISFQGLPELVGFEIVAKCSLKKPCYVATIEDPVRVDVHVDTAVEFAGEYPGWIYGGVHACGAVHTSVKAICNFAKYPAHGHRDLALVEQHRLGAHKA